MNTTKTWLIFIFVASLYACNHRTEEIYDVAKNVDFIQWSDETGIPEKWHMRESENYAKMFSKVSEEGGVKLEQSNGKGEHFLYQKLSVKRHQFYTVGVDADYDIKNYKPGGLFVTSVNGDTLLAESMLFQGAGKKRLEVVFNSNGNDSVAVNLGFRNGMKGKIEFKGLTFEHIQYNPTKFSSEVGNYLVQKLNLSFDKNGFDRSIDSICSYTNRLLLAYQMKDDLALSDKRIFQKVSQGSDYRYLNKYLDDKYVGWSYCQKSSLSLAEILQTEFNIPVRQNHMQENDTGIHQFIEYWNPFNGKWIAMDPMFSMRYQVNGENVGTEDFESFDISYIKKLFFHSDLHGLADYQGGTSLTEYWERTTLMTKKSILQTYPY